MDKSKTPQTRRRSSASNLDKEKQEKLRYNESEAMQAFLSSEKGITFLIDSAKEAKIQAASGRVQERDIGYITDELLDFYSAWSFSCPIRRNNKFSQYELIKKIEEYCSKPEVKKFFDYLFID